MKVGIMSMQRIINNGSYLQSYSLKKNIEALGHEVIFVDYEVGENLLKETSEEEKCSLKDKVVKKIKDCAFQPRKKKASQMQSEAEQYYKTIEEYKEKMLPILGVTKEPVYRPKLDALVIGSDEVFNCLQPNDEVGYSKQLFGAESNAKKVLSYAASFGNTTEEGLKQYGIDKEVGGFLEEMDAVSVRDKNSVLLVEKLAKKEPYYHVDPVFLYDYEEEMPKSVPDSNYIVVYAYWDRISQKEAKAIVQFAKKTGKKIVTLCGMQSYMGKFAPANPFEVLSYVKNADYVITDTFHGSVFSIKFNKKFATIVRKGTGKVYGNSNKLEDLLERFGLSNRIINNMSQLEQVMEQSIDYGPVNEKIQKEKAESIRYLEEQLNR